MTLICSMMHAVRVKIQLLGPNWHLMLIGSNLTSYESPADQVSCV